MRPSLIRRLWKTVTRQSCLDNSWSLYKAWSISYPFRCSIVSLWKTNENRAKLLGEVNGEARDENSFQNGVPHSATNGNSSDVPPPEEAVMFSDTADTVISPEQRPWNGGNEILQAINISLTNRHSMREGEKLNDEAVSDDSHVQQKENNGLCEQPVGVETGVTSCHVNGSHTIDSREEVKSQNTDVSCVEVKSVVDAINVEPRASFLHGSAASNAKNVPCAIYGPGSDLFVSRSSSSSSSSSLEELGKSQVSLSVSVTVSNGTVPVDTGEHDSAFEIGSSRENHSESEQGAIDSPNASRVKPKIPAKPLKPPPCARPQSVGTDQRCNSKEDNRITVNNRKPTETQNADGVYYSVANSSPGTKVHKSVTLIDHYAESNIYHEVADLAIKQTENDSKAATEGRESKLAALAMELEQVRHSGNTKRQAPAPPRVPEPPSEDPPSCSARTPSPIDVPQNFSTFRGETMTTNANFSSASSTTSSSSQDTETGFTSWNVGEDVPRYSKSKSSFLQTQYSRCKLLAMGYSDDHGSGRTKKKFSLKKLLKIGKEDSHAIGQSNHHQNHHDPNCPNPKAWKYSDHFERPRAKLEIIHPMDLENKSVTVNPGFDGSHSGSMSSFSIGDDVSTRNSVSSDYGSYYSDTMSPTQDLKSEVNYEYIQPRVILSNGHETSGQCSSASPTPSRCSSTSQASTLTSGSSKTSGGTPHRPPKPPPPPRAHSLLPVNKIQRNNDGTFKFPIGKEEKSTISVNSDEALPPKPQAPRRHSKSAAPRCEYDNFSDTRNMEVDVSSHPENVTSANSSSPELNNRFDLVPETHRVSIDEMDKDTTNNENDIKESEEELQPISKQFESMISSLEQSVEDITALESSTLTLEDNESDDSNQEIAELEPDKSTESQGISKSGNQKSKASKATISRNKHPPLTKSPPRQPPIYTKPQTITLVRNNPWRTLEDSYMVLSSSNREILTRLVNQALRKRQNRMEKLCRSQLTWLSFEIDTRQASSVFAFGDKIAYHATVPKYPEYKVTLVITIQQQPCGLNVNDMKYPVVGQFIDSVPGELLDDAKNPQLEAMQATVLVLDRSSVTTVECFVENLPDSLSEDNEKELCFIILQLIQALKSLQAQGIETVDATFQHLILAKLKKESYYTLVFLTDSYLEDIDNNYMSEFETNRLSLCQYALMLLFQTFRIQSVGEFDTLDANRFSNESSRRIFEVAILFLSEEKAVSLSQTKTLLECFLWGVTKVLRNPDIEDADGMLHRWLDIERSYFIKAMVSDETSIHINTQDEYYSQFLTRTSIRNIREVTSYL